MVIEDNILRYYLRNCYFINGTAYAGKSTMCAMLAERFGMLHCAENYNLDTILSVAEPDRQPNLCYVNKMPSWQHFVNRTPEEYEAWTDGNARELTGFEIAELTFPARFSSGSQTIIMLPFSSPRSLSPWIAFSIAAILKSNFCSPSLNPAPIRKRLFAILKPASPE